MIRAAFFDLDGTLYDRDLLVQNLAENQFLLFEDELPMVDKQHFIQRIVALDEHGNGDKAELYKRVTAEWNLSPEIGDRLLSHFWSSYTSHCRPFEDAHLTLQKLRSHGTKLGVITNGQTKWQQQKLDSLGLASMFDTVLISETEGVRKPERAIFERALSRCNVGAAESVFIGDNPEADVASAMAAGMIAVWKYVPYWEMKIEGVLIVRQLKEILPVCMLP